MKSEIYLFLLFIFIIFETNFDIGVMIAFVFIGIVLLDCFFNKQKIRVYTKKNQSVVLKTYLLMCFFQIVITIIVMPFEYSTYMYAGVKVFIANTIMIYLTMIYFISHIDIARFIKLIKAFAIVVGILGTIETFIKKNIFSFINIGYFDTSSYGTKDFRTTLFFGHPAILAIFIVVGIASLLYFPCKKIGEQYVFLAFMLISLYGTKTRSMWLSVAIIVMLFIVDQISNGKTKIKKKTIFSAFLIIAIFFALIITNYSTIINILSELENYLSLMFDSNNTYVSRVVRIKNISNVIQYLKANPINIFIGKGLGYETLFSKMNGVKLYYGDIWTSGIDNQYVTLVLQTGIWGVCSYIICVISAVVIFMQSKNNNIKLACLYVIIIGLSSVSIDSFGWRVCVFILQFGIMVINKGKIEKWTEQNY